MPVRLKIRIDSDSDETAFTLDIDIYRKKNGSVRSTPSLTTRRSPDFSATRMRPSGGEREGRRRSDAAGNEHILEPNRQNNIGARWTAQLYEA